MAKKEAWHQVHFFAKCAELAHSDPRYACIFAVPMGGKRDAITGARMKAEGARAGVPDVFVAVPAQGCHGLFLEFKIEGGRLSEKQKLWKERLHDQGYGVSVVYSYEEALNVLAAYLGAS